MPILDAIERGALFRLTRFIVLLIIFGLTVGLGIGFAVLVKYFVPWSHVSYATISQELHPFYSNNPSPAPPSADDQTAPPTLDIPSSLQPYFNTPESKDALNGHLTGLDSEGRRDYLDNLDEVVNDAKDNNADVQEVINKYFSDKDDRIGRTPGAQPIRWIIAGSVALSSVAILMLIAMASLILVLLAIERNTRRPKIIPAPVQRPIAAPPPPPPQG